MKDRLRVAVVPAYILLCIILGGSRQGIWGNLALQLLAIAIVAWSLFAKPPGFPKSARALFLLAGLIGMLIVGQLIPLPPQLWSKFPGRSHLIDSFVLLGIQTPWLSISLTPYDTMATAITLLPPVAVLVGMFLARAYRSRWICIAVLIGTLAAMMLGALQVAGPPSNASPWYLYDYSNFGVATGFFANSNHMASLILVSIPILIALIAELRDGSRKSRPRGIILFLAITGIITLLASIVFNGSFAVLLLGPPVLLASSMMLVRKVSRPRLAATVLVVLAAIQISFLNLTPLGDRVVSANEMSFNARQKIWSTTVPAIKENWATGLGISSFPRAYRGLEDPWNLEQRRANHVHNDYLEIVFETGVAGILLIIGLLIWWASRAITIWRAPAPDRYAQAATIASAALLVHSLVDYPLRTAALSAIMAACLAMMAARQRSAPNE
jgi:O-antigen ligase